MDEEVGAGAVGREHAGEVEGDGRGAERREHAVRRPEDRGLAERTRIVGKGLREGIGRGLGLQSDPDGAVDRRTEGRQEGGGIARALVADKQPLIGALHRVARDPSGIEPERRRIRDCHPHGVLAIRIEPVEQPLEGNRLAPCLGDKRGAARRRGPRTGRARRRAGPAGSDRAHVGAAADKAHPRERERPRRDSQNLAGGVAEEQRLVGLEHEVGPVEGRSVARVGAAKEDVHDLVAHNRPVERIDGIGGLERRGREVVGAVAVEIADAAHGGRADARGYVVERAVVEPFAEHQIGRAAVGERRIGEEQRSFGGDHEVRDAARAVRQHPAIEVTRGVNGEAREIVGRGQRLCTRQLVDQERRSGHQGRIGIDAPGHDGDLAERGVDDREVVEPVERHVADEGDVGCRLGQADVEYALRRRPPEPAEGGIERATGGVLGNRAGQLVEAIVGDQPGRAVRQPVAAEGRDFLGRAQPVPEPDLVEVAAQRLVRVECAAHRVLVLSQHQPVGGDVERGHRLVLRPAQDAVDIDADLARRLIADDRNVVPLAVRQIGQATEGEGGAAVDDQQSRRICEENQELIVVRAALCSGNDGLGLAGRRAERELHGEVGTAVENGVRQNYDVVAVGGETKRAVGLHDEHVVGREDRRGRELYVVDIEALEIAGARRRAALILEAEG